ncbi:hypothetical protein EAI89_08565 [Eubacterium sp. am_0171]|uniref:hypothetical protein n=1 Tax=Clostridia TaxID=186801 RepID=UPI0010211B1D|nr:MULTISPECIES: hypothetical protein [unclassified Eubacterium (in: firmicutes)]MEE0203317.1 hypothetical protein [Muricomes sp.]MSC84101.1 hypothetical protein [Eubacterium sp. BIOML-A1]MSD06233.1 hypothetical protein [Eubacterium sp. BIOML-A2]RYT21474.1 hypothetical protein EAI89_08565 [Eubacterium sp. am_0171]
MSDKDMAKQIIDALPDYKVSKILYILKGIQIDDDIEDEMFCERLAEQYIKADDHETIPFEDALREAGISIDDLQN